jgi:hypothetical protein
MNISKSLINAFEQCKKGEACFFQFQKVYIEKACRFPTFPAAKHGFFFEYLSTGQKEKENKHIPNIKSKKEFDVDRFQNNVHDKLPDLKVKLQEWIFNAADSLYVDEVVLTTQANTFHNFLELYDIKILQVSPLLEHPIKKTQRIN